MNHQSGPELSPEQQTVISWTARRFYRAVVRLALGDPTSWARVRTLLWPASRFSPAINASIPDSFRLFNPPAARPEMVDIVICVHNAPDEVRRCLASVIASTLPPYRLIIVDDRSEPETSEELTRFAIEHNAKLVRNQRNLGYTFSANVGLRLSTAPWVVLLNSDTVVSENWLDRMVELGRRRPRIGLIGPLSNTASWQSVPRIEDAGDWAVNRLPEGTDIDTMARFVARASARQGIEISFLNGFCLLIRRDVLLETGLFDEETFGAGYGEENDFCIRARQLGWQLAVADDTYVYHAHSSSYSHARRRALEHRAADALARKHNPATEILPHVRACRDGLGLTGVRSRVAAAMARQSLVETGNSAWRGKRIAFILPVAGQGGGANVVIQEARAMRLMGVDTCLVNLEHNRAGFESSYPCIDMPCLWARDEVAVKDLIVAHVPRFDAAVATAWRSLYWLPAANEIARLGYYVQDFEPMFYAPGTSEEQSARRSYTYRSDVRIFTKTAWNAERVAEVGAPMPKILGPSVDIDMFRPPPVQGSDDRWPVKVCAMLRPSSPYRSPRLTLEVMRFLQARFGHRVTMTAFGASVQEYAAAGMYTRGITNLGALRPAQVAELLERSDVFLDFSEWQAMGLTALEAMASGCAVTVPRRGGTGVFARDGATALICDTDDPVACRDAAARLVDDCALRGRLRRAAIHEATLHPPERAAVAMLNALFGEPNVGRRL